MPLSRRSFLRAGAVLAGGAAVGGPFQGFLAGPAGAAGPYGPLRPTSDLRDGAVRLDLPAGFRYRSFHVTGARLSDGTTLPGRHDGMAAFPGNRRGTNLLIRNHEVNGPVPAIGRPGNTYDPMAGGGTVTVEVDGQGRVVRDWVSLSGTQMNCSGGPTPWGSWISCEETVNGPDVGNDFTGADNSRLHRPHGYLFEVPRHGRGERRPVRAAGRFAHEAAAVDPRTGVVYLTEDNFAFPSGFYRYLAPKNPLKVGRLRDGGRLQMLAVAGRPDAPLHEGQAAGATFPVRWVDIADPDPSFAPGTSNDQAIVAVGDQGRARGAALFSRLEGAVWDRGKVWFASTQGGARAAGDSDPSGFGSGRGQVWSYDPAAETLTMVYESPSAAVLDLPDNVTAFRDGTLVLCEDGSGDNFLRLLTPAGQLFDLARNADPTQEGQEFAGATFSPDFRTLYVNIQSSSGYSIAIWGPWT